MALPLLRTALAASLAAGAASAQTPWIRYDAAFGTLPSAQGFLLRDDGWSPAASVHDGALLQGPTDFNTQQYWFAYHDLDFTRGVVVEAMINVGTSTFRLGNCAQAIRFGYYLGAVDSQGRIAYIGVADNRLFVLTSANEVPTPEAQVVTLPMQDRWRDLKMVIKASGIELYADGQYLASYPLGPVGEGRGAARMLFGDGTSCGSSQTLLRWTEIGPLAECRADFNGDGFVDFMDYDAFVACFDGDGCPQGKSADFNNDGFVDFFDYDDFVAAFEWGCTADGGGGGSPIDG